MFRRRWSALPVDPTYGNTLEELGYFVNEDDEIRSIENPIAYFKFFLSKNMRWNDRQRFHMNLAIEEIVHERLERLGLEKLNLPLGTPAGQPHVPIYISKNLLTVKRIIVIIQEPYNDLGILAHRVIGGIGGIDYGSMVSPVKYLQKTQPDVGIVIANLGQLWWWDEGKRALTQQGRLGVPMRSAVCWGYDDPCYQDSHTIRKNSCDREHIQCVFEDLLGNPEVCNPEATIDVIGLGIGGNTTNDFLDVNWDAWKDRVKSFCIVGGTTSRELMVDDGFAQWARDRALAFVISSEPLGRVISSADGNEKTSHYTGFGCPVLASGESSLIEMMFVKNHEFVLDKIKQVAEGDAAGGAGYKNPDYSGCDYEDAQKKEAREMDAAVESAWKDANPEKPDWSEHTGPSIGDVVGENPDGVPETTNTNGGDMDSDSVRVLRGRVPRH